MQRKSCRTCEVQDGVCSASACLLAYRTCFVLWQQKDKRALRFESFWKCEVFSPLYYSCTEQIWAAQYLLVFVAKQRACSIEYQGGICVGVSGSGCALGDAQRPELFVRYLSTQYSGMQIDPAHRKVIMSESIRNWTEIGWDPRDSIFWASDAIRCPEVKMLIVEIFGSALGLFGVIAQSSVDPRSWRKKNQEVVK